MIQSNGELLWQAHCKGFIPDYEAIEVNRYLQSKLVTGANYCWKDKKGNEWAFGYGSKKEEVKRPVIKKGFRGYKYQPIIK